MTVQCLTALCCTTLLLSSRTFFHSLRSISDLAVFHVQEEGEGFVMGAQHDLAMAQW